MFDLPDLHQVFADNISVVLKAIAYIFEQCWYGEILVLLGWCIWSRNQNVLPDCSGCAMRLWVQMAVAGELFLTIFSMCLHLFEDDRANRELFMNQMLSFFFPHPIIMYIALQLISRCGLWLLNLRASFCVFYLISAPYLVAELENADLHLMKGFLVPSPLTVWPLGVCIKLISMFFFIASWKFIQLTCKLN